MQALNTCKCVCGALVALKYKKGHGRKGRKNSPEHNARISVALTKHPAGYKKNHSQDGLYHGARGSQELREYQSRMAKERGFGKWMKGRKIPKEVIEKVLASRKGYRMSEETKRKIGLKNSGERNGMFGREVSKETRLKLSAASRRAWLDPNNKLHAYLLSDKHIESCRKGAIAAQLVKEDTSIERRIRGFLTTMGVEFEAHRLFDTIKHPYRCDFYIPRWRLVIECDGNYWHNYPKGRGIDKLRTLELGSAGYNVLRLWEHEIKSMSYGGFVLSIRRYIGAIYRDYYCRGAA